MPVTAFPPSSDASVESGAGSAGALPRSQVPSTPEAGSTFDQFLPKAKAKAPAAVGSPGSSAAGNSAANPGSATASGPAKPALLASILRRTRDRGAPTPAPADPDAPAAADPTPSPVLVTPAPLDLANAQPAVLALPALPVTAADPDDGAGESDLTDLLASPPATSTAGAPAPVRPAPAVAGTATAAANLAAAMPPSPQSSPEFNPATAAPAPAAPPTSSAPASLTTASPAAGSQALAAAAAPAGSPAGRLADRANKATRSPATAAAAPARSTAPADASADAPAADDLISEIRIRPAPAPLDDGAKSAATLPALPPLAANAINAGEKKSLIIAIQPDKMVSPSVGIDAAQASPAMTLDSSAIDRLPPPPSITAPSGMAPAAASAAPTPANASARIAVDAVIKLLDVQSGRSQEPVSAVSLNFKFGGDDLAVRVEWRNGEVHTQFRTDSPELRSALASQWQAVSPSTGSRATPFAAPVFSSTGDQAASASRDERQARQFGEDSGFSGQTARSRTRPKAPAPSAALASVVPLRSPALSSALRLHTFA